MKPFDPTKPVQTRDGRPARIICTDQKKKAMTGELDVPIIALCTNLDGQEEVSSHTADGRWSYWNKNEVSMRDLVNITEEKSRWINIHKGSFSGDLFGGDVFLSKEEALKHTNPNVIDTVEIKWKE